LKPELHVSNVKNVKVSTSKKIHCFSSTDTGPLMLFRKIIAPYFENYIKIQSVRFGSCNNLVSNSIGIRRCVTGGGGRGMKACRVEEEVKLATHLYLVPKLRRRGATPPLSQLPSWPGA
jgi:hypothetical protein